MPLWPFEVKSSTYEKPIVVVGKSGSKKELYAEEIIAMILLKMKKIAETYLGEPCYSAVVSVPAFFNN